MKIHTNFGDFIKKLNEDIEPIETPDTLENDITDGAEATEDIEDEDSSNLIDDVEDIADEEDIEEEEEDSYSGAGKIRALAEMLGTKAKGNEIDYNGKKIHYYSETEAFHVDKKKFEEPEDVVEYLEISEDEPVIEESRRNHRRILKINERARINKK